MTGEAHEHVLLYLRSGVWVEGSATFLTHAGLLNFVNDPSCNFLPLSDVKMYKKKEEPPTEIDFLAVNIEDVTFMTVIAEPDDTVAREEIVHLVTSNGQKNTTPQNEETTSTLKWLDEEIVARLDTCDHLLGNGRTDDRNAGIKLILKEISAEIQKRSKKIKPPE